LSVTRNVTEFWPRDRFCCLPIASVLEYVMCLFFVILFYFFEVRPRVSTPGPRLAFLSVTDVNVDTMGAGLVYYFNFVTDVAII
jgi:hypothetical protein